jgi:hypothetical protein
MASTNVDRVIMAAVPGFGFPVNAPNVATPRSDLEKRETQNTNLNEPVYCFDELLVASQQQFK